MLDDGIYTLAYFYEDSVTSCKEIEKDCDKKDCIKKIIIIEKKRKKKIHACNRINFSSNINEVIRIVLNFLLFFYEKTSRAPKALKALKALKAPKALKGTKTLRQKHKTQISE